MTSPLDSLVRALEATNVNETGVSFAGKSLKLDSAADAKQVTDEIDKCRFLNFLNLEGNTLGVGAAKAVGKSLENHPELKRALWKDMFTGRMKTEIPNALKFLGDGLVTAGCQLTELDMSDNAFGPIGVGGLASLIRSPSCFALEELRLNNNGLGISGGKLLAQALTDCYNLSKAAGKQLKLRVFIAGRNRLENDGAKALAEVFQMIGTLEEIEMPQNGIYHVGIKALSEALVHNKSLKVLNLNDNTIGKKGSHALSKALPALDQLQVINFGDCLLKTSGAQMIADAIMSNHEKLEKLILDANEIQKSGAISIVRAIANKPKLQTLELNANMFGEEGREAIKEELDKIGKLDTLGSLEDDESDEDEEKYGEDSEELSTDSEEETEITVDEFFKTPTESNFMKLGDNRKNLILTESQKTGEIVLEDYVRILMNVSSLYGSSDERVRIFALDVLASLYKDLFTWSTLKKNSPYVFNVVFVNLGLIKCEDKNFTPTWDTRICQDALRAIKKNDCIPLPVRNILDIFFAKSS